MHWKPLLSGKVVTRTMPGLTSCVMGILGAALIALPVDAASLLFWRFDQQQNQLTFTTDTQVRPTAQLIFNPTRLVIDLPDTQVTSSSNQQQLQAGLRTVRVGQLDEQTARIVIELESGYTLDPQQVQVRGETNRRWSVQLPELTQSDRSRTTTTARPRPASPPPTQTTNQVTAVNVSNATTQVQGVVATADGFFIRVSGDTPQIQVSRPRRRRRNPERKIILELPNSSISPGLRPESLPNGRYSVANWDITQSGSKVIITMTLAEESPDWRATVTEISTSIRGISILPDNIAIREIPDSEAPNTLVQPPTVAERPRVNLPGNGNNRPETPTETESGSLPRINQGRIVVAIDPGHGGRDPGAVGIGGLQEKQVILPISQQVATILRQQGVDVVMTRDRDFELDLDPRVQIAERADADLFVSIHANAISLSRPDVNGLETYYYSSAGARFARTVHNIVLRTMGMRDRKVRQARFYVVRRTSMPAILIEVGFVTGAEDVVNLREPEWRSQMANAIARGILIHIQREL